MDNQENRIWNLPALNLSQKATPEELTELHSISENFSDFKNIANSIDMYCSEKNKFINNDDSPGFPQYHFKGIFERKQLSRR